MNLHLFYISLIVIVIIVFIVIQATKKCGVTSCPTCPACPICPNDSRVPITVSPDGQHVYARGFIDADPKGSMMFYVSWLYDPTTYNTNRTVCLDNDNKIVSFSDTCAGKKVSMYMLPPTDDNMKNKNPVYFWVDTSQANYYMTSTVPQSAYSDSPACVDKIVFKQ